MTCADCNGTGAPSAVAGHCFDIDGGLWHRPGECPDQSWDRCCTPCATCRGRGQAPNSEGTIR